MHISKIHNHLKESRIINAPTSNTPTGHNKRPDGKTAISFDKNRKFASTPKEYAALIHEVFENTLTEKGFDRVRKNILVRIAKTLITKENYREYINLSSQEVYNHIEEYIISKLK